MYDDQYLLFRLLDILTAPSLPPSPKRTCTCTYTAAAAKPLQSCLTLCNPIDSSPPGSAIPGILQARTLELGCHFLLQRMKVKSESEDPQLCPTLCAPMDCSLQASSVHGIFQARVLEWVAIAFSDFEDRKAQIWDRKLPS